MKGQAETSEADISNNLAIIVKTMWIVCLKKSLKQGYNSFIGQWKYVLRRWVSVWFHISCGNLNPHGNKSQSNVIHLWKYTFLHVGKVNHIWRCPIHMWKFTFHMWQSLVSTQITTLYWYSHSATEALESSVLSEHKQPSEASWSAKTTTNMSRTVRQILMNTNKVLSFNSSNVPSHISVAS